MTRAPWRLQCSEAPRRTTRCRLNPARLDRGRAESRSRVAPTSIFIRRRSRGGEIKKRTLTNLYNARPQWLADAHRDLDAAVAAAYGWAADISDEDALTKLLELNVSQDGIKPVEATMGWRKSIAPLRHSATCDMGARRAGSRRSKPGLDRAALGVCFVRRLSATGAGERIAEFRAGQDRAQNPCP